MESKGMGERRTERRNPDRIRETRRREGKGTQAKTKERMK